MRISSLSLPNDLLQRLVVWLLHMLQHISMSKHTSSAGFGTASIMTTLLLGLLSYASSMFGQSSILRNQPKSSGTNLSRVNCTTLISYMYYSHQQLLLGMYLSDA